MNLGRVGSSTCINHHPAYGTAFFPSPFGLYEIVFPIAHLAEKRSTATTCEHMVRTVLRVRTTGKGTVPVPALKYVYYHPIPCVTVTSNDSQRFTPTTKATTTRHRPIKCHTLTATSHMAVLSQQANCKHTLPPADQKKLPTKLPSSHAQNTTYASYTKYYTQKAGQILEYTHLKIQL